MELTESYYTGKYLVERLLRFLYYHLNLELRKMLYLISNICLDWFYMETLKKLSHHVIVQNLRLQDAATTTPAIMEW